MLFSADSLWTMLHGIVLGGGALMGMAAALFCLHFMAARPGAQPSAGQSAAVAGLLVLVAVLLWLTVIGGTYIVFPPYRVTPPPGTTDLSEFPRALILSNPDTAWLHSFAMESKEHVPFIVAMLATSAAFVARRHRTSLLEDAPLRRMVFTLTAICFVLASYIALLGVFINKVAPLE